MTRLSSMVSMITQVNRMRTLHTSHDLMCELYAVLGDLGFAENLAITVRNSRSQRATFSLVFFWNPLNVNMGYLTIVADVPHGSLMDTLESIKRQGSLSGYFDLLLAKVTLASTPAVQN